LASSNARARRIAVTVAASDSIARSASTTRISGWSASAAPNACRWAAWCRAWTVACRMVAVAPSTQSSRVWVTMSMIVRTPRPSSPTSQASAPSSSISLEAFERLPSLSFRRTRRKPTLRSPSGSHRGTRKHDSPPGAWASMRNASDIGAEQNHLWPVSM
jgi:hypothetical protein